MKQNRILHIIQVDAIFNNALKNYKCLLHIIFNKFILKICHICLQKNLTRSALKMLADVVTYLIEIIVNMLFQIIDNIVI